MFHISNKLLNQLWTGALELLEMAFLKKSVSEEECHFFLSHSGIGQHTRKGRKQRVRQEEE